MAHAARPAHPLGVSLCAAATALALALAPGSVQAQPAAAAPEAEPPADEPAGDDGEAEGADPIDTAEVDADEADDVAEADADEAEAEADDEAEAEADDEAEAEAEAEADDDAIIGAAGPTAEPLRPMQTAAWWTMFGAFAVGTTAGVLAGLAERQEDRATRLSTLFDSQTGAQPLYADRQDEYEQYLSRGDAFAKAAIGVGVVAGVATITAITLFAIDARRQRTEQAPRERKRAALRVRGGGVEVRF